MMRQSPYLLTSLPAFGAPRIAPPKPAQRYRRVLETRAEYFWGREYVLPGAMLFGVNEDTLTDADVDEMLEEWWAALAELNPDRDWKAEREACPV